MIKETIRLVLFVCITLDIAIANIEKGNKSKACFYFALILIYLCTYLKL